MRKNTYNAAEATLNLVQVDANIADKLEAIGGEKVGKGLRAMFETLSFDGTDIAREGLIEHFRVCRAEGFQPDQDTIKSILNTAANGKSIVQQYKQKPVKVIRPVTTGGDATLPTKTTRPAKLQISPEYINSQREIQEMFRLCKDPDVIEAERLRKQLQALYTKPNVRRAYELRRKHGDDFDYQMKKILNSRRE